jgi:transcriptional regulator with XRE-family HTH domain
MHTERKTKGKSLPIDYLVGERLRSRRIICGMRQQELADALNITPQQIQKYETGANRIASGKLYYLAKWLKVPIEYFFHSGDGLDIDIKKQNIAISLNMQSDTTIENELISLISSYRALKSPVLRKKLLSLAQSMAATIDS